MRIYSLGITSLLFLVPALAQVQITAPAANSTVNGNVTFAATAPGAATVDYWMAGHSIVPAALPAAAPFSATVDSTMLWDGPVQVVAVARDRSGNFLASSAPLNLTINNFNQTHASLVAPDITQPLSGAVNFQVAASDSRGIQAFVYAVDGAETPHPCLCGTSFTDSFTLDTSTLSNGVHYLLVEIVPPDTGSGSPAQGSGELLTQFTVNNPVGPLELRSGMRHIYFQPGQTAAVQLAPHVIDNDGSDHSAGTVTYTVDNASIASVSSTGLVTPGAQQGIATITITSQALQAPRPAPRGKDLDYDHDREHYREPGQARADRHASRPLTVGRFLTTTVRVVNVTSHAGFPHFTKDGHIVYSYDPAKSLWVRTLFNTNIWPTLMSTPGFGTAVANANVNALTSNFYQNPSDNGASDLNTWETNWGNFYQSQLSAVKSANLSLVLTGDDIQRTTNEMNNTLTSSWAPATIQYSLNQLVTSGVAVSIEMQDEAGGTPVPQNYRNVVGILNSAPARPPITWPVAGLQGADVFAAWEGDPTLSDYTSMYWTYPYCFRPEFPWGYSLHETKINLEQSVLGKLAGTQLDKPKYMEVQTYGYGYIKRVNGDYFHPGPSGDEMTLPPFAPEQITSQILYAAALGFAGVRAYGYDGSNTVVDLGWAYHRANDAASSSGNLLQQTGTSPFTNYQDNKDRWTAMTNAFTFIKSLEPYMLSPQMHALDLGLDIPTGARQLSGNGGRLFMAINMSDNTRTVNVDLTSYRYPGATTVTRYHINGLTSTSEPVTNDSAPTVTMAPGEMVAWLFTPPAAPPPNTTRSSIEVTGATPTQAVVHVSALNADGSPYTGTCTYRASEGNTFTSPVNDVNPALFPGANSDARSGSTINGKDHYFVLGTRTAAKGSDGKYYSRALQADTLHWVGATCSGSEISTTFKTQNPPLGNSYPEFPAFDSGSYGNHAAPTIDFSDKTKTYIDPLTGILFERISSPLDVAVGDQRQTFAYYRDITGSGWSNAANAITAQNSGTLASTSTPNAGLFLAWQGLSGDGVVINGTDYSESNMDLRPTPSDLMLRVYGSGRNGAVLASCISLDSGQSCATDEVDVTLPSSTTEVDAPNNYPAPMFAGWGTQHQALNKQMLCNLPQYTVNVSGSTVTWVSGSYFIVERAPGSKIQIPGAAPACPNNVCTIKSLDSPTQMTIQESAGNLTNVAAQDYGAGVLVWLKNTGGSPSASVSITYDHVTSWQSAGASNAEFDTCSTMPVTDISTDRTGRPISPPLTGYLCSLGQSTLILWIPSTGESRLISSYYQQGVGRMLVPTNPFSTTDPKTLFATNVGTGHLYKATLNNPAGNYTEYVPGIGLAPATDNLVWTDLTAATSTIDQQLAAYGGSVATAYATGLFPPLHFVGVVGGYAIYDTSSTTDGPCIKIRAIADTNQLIQAFDSWDKFPLRWGGCHSSPTGIGSLLSLSLNGIERAATGAVLGGPFTLNITQLKRAGSWTTYSQAITGASNASPVVFTSPVHQLDATLPQIAQTLGPQVTISGGTGAWAAVNGTWTATVIDGNTFSIPVNTSGFGSVSGTLQFSSSPPFIHSNVQSVSSATPAVVTVSNSWNGDPANDRFQDGDPIGFSNAPQTMQYYAKVSGYAANTFALYADHALTQPVSGVGLNSLNSGYVYYAETCPSGLSPLVTSSMPFDTGASGVRCLTVRVSGEPCSAYASSQEHSVYPCKSDPNNASKSSLSDIQIGDAIRDISKNVYDETFIIANKVKNSENDIELTLMRWYGNQIGGDGHAGNPYGNTHRAGWMPFMVPSNSRAAATGWMDATDPTNSFLSADPNYALAHGDFAWGNAPGLFTYAGGQADSISNKTVKDLLATPLTYTKKENPPWADAAASQMAYGSLIQSYPGHRQFGAPKPEFRWKGDWAAINSTFGNDQTAGLGLIGSNGLTSIRGTQYDSGSTTKNVYKISNVAGAYDRKRSPTYAWAGKYMFADKSGPGSVITDADLWRYCVADNPGECRPGSAKNDTFLVATNVYNTNNWCWTDTLNFTVPCFSGANPLGGWATQVEIDPVDTTARRFRRLTLGLSAPGMHWTFSTWLQTPGGKWGFFSAPYANGLRNDYFAMKLPPWPTQEQTRDSINRSTFVPVHVHLAPFSGAAFARARFGYAENAAPSSFYCTSRQEACSTEIPVNSPSDPYAFASEAATHMSCANGCTVTIPSIPGRVVYYVIDRLDASGQVIHTSPMQAVAKP